MMGMPRRGGMEAQHVTFVIFTVHDFSAQFAATRPRRTGLHKKHCLYARLHRIMGKIIENGERRIKKTGRAWPVVKGQQKTDRGL